eukprot:jgi/Picsp_1/1479/NSC_04957-R1_protein
MGETGGRYSRLDQNSLNYFREVDAHFKGLTDDDQEDKEILVQNVFEELGGREAEIVCDAECSRIVESLMPHASQQVLRDFSHNCLTGENLGLICTSGPFGSHVLESLLDNVARKISDVSIDSTLMQEILDEFTEVSVSNFLDMVCSKYGSFVARRLVNVLSGELHDPKRSKRSDNSESMSRSYVNTNKLNLAIKMSAQTNSSQQTTQIEPRLDLLRKICGTFTSDEMTPKDIHDLQRSPFAGPFLKNLLEAVGRVGSEDEKSSLVICLLGGNPAVGPDTITADSLFNLMTDRSGSHLMEAALSTAPGNLFSKLCTTCFKGKLVSLAQHPVGNFPVQAAISNIQKPQQLRRMFEDLKPQIGTLIKARRGGVVTVLLGAAARIGAIQAEVSDALWSSVKESFIGEQHATPIHTLLTLDTNVVLGEDTRGRLSPLGCSALSTIFQYPRAMNKEWRKCLERMTSSEVVHVALDQGGCRVLESFICNDDTKQSYRDDLLKQISGKWADVASFGSGSKFTEICYYIGGPAIKREISQDLAAAQARIAGVYRGAKLLRVCKVDEMKQNGDRWEEKIAAVAATKREFEQIFGNANEEKEQQNDSAEKDIEKKKRKKEERKKQKDSESSKSKKRSKDKTEKVRKVRKKSKS